MLSVLALLKKRSNLNIWTYYMNNHALKYKTKIPFLNTTRYAFSDSKSNPPPPSSSSPSSSVLTSLTSDNMDSKEGNIKPKAKKSRKKKWEKIFELINEPENNNNNQHLILDIDSERLGFFLIADSNNEGNVIEQAIKKPRKRKAKVTEGNAGLETENELNEKGKGKGEHLRKASSILSSEDNLISKEEDASVLGSQAEPVKKTRKKRKDKNIAESISTSKDQSKVISPKDNSCIPPVDNSSIPPAEEPLNTRVEDLLNTQVKEGVSTKVEDLLNPRVEDLLRTRLEKEPLVSPTQIPSSPRADTFMGDKPMEGLSIPKESIPPEPQENQQDKVETKFSTLLKPEVDWKQVFDGYFQSKGVNKEIVPNYEQINEYFGWLFKEALSNTSTFTQKPIQDSQIQEQQNKSEAQTQEKSIDDDYHVFILAVNPKNLLQDEQNKLNASGIIDFHSVKISQERYENLKRKKHQEDFASQQQLQYQDKALSSKKQPSLDRTTSVSSESPKYEGFLTTSDGSKKQDELSKQAEIVKRYNEILNELTQSKKNEELLSQAELSRKYDELLDQAELIRKTTHRIKKMSKHVDQPMVNKEYVETNESIFVSKRKLKPVVEKVIEYDNSLMTKEEYLDQKKEQIVSEEKSIKKTGLLSYVMQKFPNKPSQLSAQPSPSSSTTSTAQNLEKSEKSEKPEKPENKVHGIFEKSYLLQTNIAKSVSIQMQSISTLDQLITWMTANSQKEFTISDMFIIYHKLHRTSFKLNDANATQNAAQFNIEPIQSFLNRFVEMMKKENNPSTIKIILTIFQIRIPNSLAEKFGKFYQDAISYILSNEDHLDPKDIIGILQELKYYYADLKQDEIDNNNGKMILEVIKKTYETLSIYHKMLVLQYMNMSRIYDDEILDYILYYTQHNHENMSISDVLLVIDTLCQNKKMIPYELVYRLRNKFNMTFNNLDDKIIIKFFKLFAKLKLMHGEVFFENIFKRLRNPKLIDRCNINDVVWIINAYSKIKYREEVLFKKFMDKIMLGIKELTLFPLKILLLALAELNYQDQTIYMKLYEHYNLVLIIENMNQTLTPNEKMYFEKICQFLINNKANGSSGSGNGNGSGDSGNGTGNTIQNTILPSSQRR